MTEREETPIETGRGAALVPQTGREPARLRPIRAPHRPAQRGPERRAPRAIAIARPAPARVLRSGGPTAGGILKGIALRAFALAAVASALVMLLLLVTLWNFFAVTGRATATIGDRLNEAVARTGQA